MVDPIKMPKHRKGCPFLEDTRKRCTCSAKFLGKPFSHWQDEAEYYIVDYLIRGSTNIDERSIIGKLVQARLWELALQENPEMVERILKEITRFHEGVCSAMNDILRD